MSIWNTNQDCLVGTDKGVTCADTAAFPVQMPRADPVYKWEKSVSPVFLILKERWG